MSIFTNPASGARDVAGAYVKAVLALVEDRDPMVVLSATVPRVTELVRTLTPSQLIRPEEPGKWSIRELVWHLADSELVWGYRIRMILAHDRPVLEGYDQDRWVERLRYRDRETEHAVDQLRVLREIHLALLSSLTAEEWSRAGLHSERGEESLSHLVRLYAGHDLVHLRQARRIVGGLGSG